MAMDLVERAKQALSSRFSCPGEVTELLRECISEIDQLRQRLLTAAGDDLCRLTQEEIKQLSDGAVKIPPKEEFLASCERFYSQIANESGVMENCLTLAQLVAENERLHEEGIERLRSEVAEWKHRAIGGQCEILSNPDCDCSLCKRDWAIERLRAEIEELTSEKEELVRATNIMLENIRYEEGN